ncbi:Kinesin light chain [Trichoplax sp. H2]|nr:Kinesin light chain [Trichoplax sp. H2]|eukprot:RDD45495.1 Kinesin light chain [Trichoplax sp. H2]
MKWSALTYYSKYEETLSMYDKSLDIRLSALGQNYSDGKYASALSTYDESLNIRLLVFGQNHPNVAKLYRNMGIVFHYQSKFIYQHRIVYRDKGKYDKVLSMYDKSFNIRLLVLSQNHPDLSLWSKPFRCCRSFLRKQIKHYEAHSMFDKSLRINLSVLVTNHPDLGYLYYNIGFAYESQSMYDEALSAYEKSFSIRFSGLTLEQKIYFNAYDRALNQGQCHNNLIRGIYIGPRNVGKIIYHNIT